MTETEFRKAIQAIRPVDEAMAERAWQRQDSLVKPPRSLGRLEELSVQLSAITGKLHNTVEKRCIVICCADNGVVEEGVSSAPQSVTLAQTVNFTRGKTGVAALSKEFGVELMVIDVGINAEFSCPGVLNRKIRKGTFNLAKRPVMERWEAVEALGVGLEAARRAREQGYDILGVGEMGIGNTTTSSAVLCALTGLPVEKTVGRGGGISLSAYERKKRLIEQALKAYRPDPNDPVDVLAKVGGFDIAAMAGVFLGAARERLPVVIDGFISAVAALCAARIEPKVKGYLIPSHASYEIGYSRAMEELGLRPVLLLDMRLGEGSGCPLAFEVIRAACAVMNGMATFAEADIDDGYLESIRKEDSFSVEGAGGETK